MKLLKNGFIYDGSGAEPFKGDILIEEDKIINISSNIQPEEGYEVVDLAFERFKQCLS